MKKYAFGVDIGGTTVKIGLFDREGAILDKWEIPTNKENHAEKVLPDIASSLISKLAEKEIAREDIEGIGVGSPGSITADGYLRSAVNIGWEELDLTGELTRLTGFPTKASNDANVAAFGEMWMGAGKGCDNILMVTLGTGVGGGVIVNGEILSGATGSGGEIGHIHVEDNENEPCNCKNCGCLEQYGSATGIARLARKRLAKDNEKSSLRDIEPDKLSAKDVFDALKAGDKLAREVGEQFADYLGKGLGIIASVTDPERIVIGGGVSRAGEIIIELVEPKYRKYAYPPCGKAQVVLATLGNDAGIYGAAGLILRKTK
ncbi:MAG: ROK family glucokinase [Lachnospiraceae bacterium]|nr:ROK family glucokinase [Lachnospiraceae bacterium]